MNFDTFAKSECGLSTGSQPIKLTIFEFIRPMRPTTLKSKKDTPKIGNFGVFRILGKFKSTFQALGRFWEKQRKNIFCF